MGRLLGKFFGISHVQEIPNGTIDGNNVSFLLSQQPATTGSLIVFVDGILQSDYSLSGQAITFSVAPTVGQSVTAFYIKQS